ncbi:beta-1,4-N-acetylgalactosaminyltransferase bre-4-like [Ostrinia nubilalis]|uniref:beta-1,4-N-acetylgalactosaminyltransferase bre-4-like n=1 Tax=Ostrinia nubilalis TaxID=29057 RepID=UPI0030825730
MHPFLIEQGLEYRIFVIEQNGREQFNRGRLLNVGYLEAKKHGNWECMVFHDVDLLPTTDRIKYSCPTWPRHMSAYVIGRPESENYKSHYGGVSVMTPSQFEKVNGYSNRYWGWGGEDTDMFWRIKHSGLALTRYSKSIAKYMALPHKQEPENPTRKKLLKTAMDEKSYKIDGLSNCHYKIVSKTMYHTYTHILVDINPNKTMS